MFDVGHTKPGGFTIIETLVVMAIVGAIALVAIPATQHYLETDRLKAAAESLSHDFHKAQSEALKSQTDVRVVFQAGAKWCYGITTASTCDCQVANACTLGQVKVSDVGSSTMSLVGLTTHTLFTKSRGLVSVTGTVNFTGASGKVLSVELNKMGFVKVCSSNVSGYSAC